MPTITSSSLAKVLFLFFLFCLPLSGFVELYSLRLTWNDFYLGLMSVLGLLFIVFERQLLWSRYKEVLVNIFIITGIFILVFILGGQVLSLWQTAFKWIAMMVFLLTIMLFKDKWGKTYLLFVLAAAATGFSIWGVTQFIIQKSVGYSIAGESMISASTAAVAKFQMGSAKLIRAYGPFSHANSLAGALSLGFVASCLLWRKRQSAAMAIMLYCIGLGLIVTFSRAAWLAGLLIIMLTLSRCSARERKLFTRQALVPLLLTIFVFMPLLLARQSDVEDRGAADRLAGYSQWTQVVRQRPVWRGTGPGNYPSALQALLTARHISYQPWEIAPVHSAPLLIIAEWGILPAGMLFLWLGYVFWRQEALVGVLVPLTPLFLFDHYFVTQLAPLVLLTMFAAAVLATGSGKHYLEFSGMDTGAAPAKPERLM